MPERGDRNDTNNNTHRFEEQGSSRSIWIDIAVGLRLCDRGDRGHGWSSVRKCNTPEKAEHAGTSLFYKSSCVSQAQ
ncbi:hypothetical protein SRHO_G00214050 [Serrasalmus rhombeus]